MQFYPLDFEFLANLTSTSPKPADVQPRDTPGKVVLVLPEGCAKLEASRATGVLRMEHGKGFRFADKDHDWSMRNGKFYFYSHDMAPAKGYTAVTAPETANVMVMASGRLC
jgi:hypothetical protein